MALCLFGLHDTSRRPKSDLSVAAACWYLLVIGMFLAEVRQPPAIALLQRLATGGGDVQIAQQAIMNTVSPAVNGNFLTALRAERMMVEWPKL